MRKILIRGARIVDGIANTAFYGDVMICQDYIAQVGQISPNSDSFAKIIEADGLTLTPGFIDMHSHSDILQLVEGSASAKIRQGITTELLGQDGLGLAPLTDNMLDSYRQHVSGLLGNPDIAWNWRSFADYLSVLEQAKTATNLAVLVSHGPVRMAVMGMKERPADKDEMNAMCQLVTEAFAAGAFGLSTGMIYPPCVFSSKEEFVALCSIAAGHDGIFVVHVRNERGEVVEAIQEIFSLARDTKVAPHISHLKVIGRENWGRAAEILNLFDQAMNEGMNASFDQYPYPAGSTMLSILIPAHAHIGGPEALLARLGDPYMREVLARQMENGLDGWENICTAAGWDRIMVTGITDGPNKQWEGCSLAQIAQHKNISPQEVVFNLLIEENLHVSMVNFSMSEQDVAAIIQHPCGMLGTDGLLIGKPHPRAFGSAARILQQYVKEQGILTLEQAVIRMTSRPARRLGLTDRGIIKPGAKADIVLLDLAKVEERSSFENPCQHPDGFEYVFVNGEAAVKLGVETGRLSGKVLRK